MRISYLGRITIVNDTAGVDSLLGGIHHTVIGSRHLVPDRPYIPLVVECLTVMDNIAQTDDFDDADRHWELDLAMLIPFQRYHLADLGEVLPWLVRVVDPLGFLSRRTHIDNGRRYGCSDGSYS